MIYKEVETVVVGATYKLPTYSVGANGIQFEDFVELKVVKGDKTGNAPNRQTGFRTHDLLEMVKRYTQDVNIGHFESEENREFIAEIQKLQDKINNRLNDRTKRGVLNTYNK